MFNDTGKEDNLSLTSNKKFKYRNRENKITPILLLDGQLGLSCDEGCGKLR